MGRTGELMLLFGIPIALLIGLWLYTTRFQQRDDDSPVGAGDLLSEFRELHAQGKLSDEEFQTIKGKLTAQMQQEIRDKEETG